MSIADLLKYTLQQSDNNACDILFDYQGGPDAVNKYIHSLGIRECAIAGTETAMHEDLNLCYENWTTPLAAAELVEIFRKKPLFPNVYKDFIFKQWWSVKPDKTVWLLRCSTKSNRRS